MEENITLAIILQQTWPKNLLILFVFVLAENANFLQSNQAADPTASLEQVDSRSKGKNLEFFA